MSNLSKQKSRRKASRRFAKATGAVILTVLVVFAVIGVVFVQDSILYTADGMRFVPQTKRTMLTGQSDLTSAPAITLPHATTAAIRDAQVVDFPSEAIGLVDVQAVELPPARDYRDRIGRVLRRTSYCVENFSATAQMLADTGEQMVVIDLKEPSGNLAFQSDFFLAIRAGVNATDDEEYYLKTALTCLHNAGIQVAARISCLADSRLANAEPSMIQKNDAGLPCRSQAGYALLNAANGDLQEYLMSVVRDAVEFGFDMLILDDFGYLPTVNANMRELERLLTELHELCGEKKLALMLYPSSRYIQSEALQIEADELWAYQKGLGAQFRIDGARTLTKDDHT